MGFPVKADQCACANLAWLLDNKYLLMMINYVQSFSTHFDNFADSFLIVIITFWLPI